MIYDLLKDLPLPYSYISSFIWCSFLIFLSCLIAEEYIIEYLKSLLKITNIKSDIAAILFLNIGNGLPDLITSFIAVERNFSLVFFTVIGSYITLVTLVLGLIIILKKDRVVFSPANFYKNIGFLFISYIFLVYLIYEQRIDYIISTSMICMYFAFLFHSIVNSFSMERDAVEIQETGENNTNLYKPLKITMMGIKKVLNVVFLNIKELSPRIPRAIYYPVSIVINFWIFYFIFEFNTPILTLFVIQPFLIIFGVILSKADQKFHYPIFSILYGFSLSMAWIYIITNETFGIIENSEDSFGLPKEFSALTILALGNCMGDIVTGTIASKSGLFQLAATAALTSPTHNILFNLPILFFYELIRNGKNSILYKKTAANFTVPGSLIPIILIVLIFNFEMRNSKMEKELGYASIFIYLMFIVLLICEMIMLNSI